MNGVSPLVNRSNAVNFAVSSLKISTNSTANVAVKPSSAYDPHVRNLPPADITSSVSADTHAIKPTTTTNPIPQFSLISGPLSIAGLRSTASEPVLSTSINQSSIVDAGAAYTTGDSAVPTINTHNHSSSSNASAPGNGAHVGANTPHTDVANEQDNTSAPAIGTERGGEGTGSEESIEREVSQSVELVQMQELKKLQARDTEVKSHEQAHAVVGGQFARSPNFEYERGSDGQRYAVSGEVQIDVSEVSGNPLATISKMKQVYAAAMAPVNPSAADIQVASQALQTINVAKQQLAEQRVAQAPDIDDFSVSTETPEPIEKPIVGVSGSIDETGNITRPQEESNSQVSETVERINNNFKDEKDSENVDSNIATPANIHIATLAYALDKQQSGIARELNITV